MVMTAPEEVPTAEVVVGPELQHQIEQFLYFEARLLDDRRFTDWWKLFTDDVRYWMPIRYNRTHREQHLATSGPDDLATFDEDKTSLFQRVYRLGTPTAWAEDPPSRTRHLVSNVWIQHGDQTGDQTGDAGGTADGELLVQSAFLVYRQRGDRDVDIFAGRRDDVLRRSGAAWQIARRQITIDQSTILAQGLTIFF